MTIPKHKKIGLGRQQIKLHNSDYFQNYSTTYFDDDDDDNDNDDDDDDQFI